jgi:hypothetical protein
MVEFCFPAYYGGLIGLIMMIVDVFVFGFNELNILCDFLFAIIIFIIIDYFCKKNWLVLAWILFILLFLMSSLFIYLYSIKDPLFMEEVNKNI